MTRRIGEVEVTRELKLDISEEAVNLKDLVKAIVNKVEEVHEEGSEA
jgi:hypothetical protein